MHASVGLLESGLIEVERIGVFHDELSRAHHAKARPDFVAKLSLNLIEVDRQLLIAAQFSPSDVGDDLFVRRSEAILTILAVFHA